MVQKVRRFTGTTERHTKVPVSPSSSGGGGGSAGGAPLYAGGGTHPLSTLLSQQRLLELSRFGLRHYDIAHHVLSQQGAVTKLLVFIMSHTAMILPSVVPQIISQINATIFKVVKPVINRRKKTSNYNKASNDEFALSLFNYHERTNCTQRSSALVSNTSLKCHTSRLGLTTRDEPAALVHGFVRKKRFRETNLLGGADVRAIDNHEDGITRC
ncbi:hypothetical protein EVAR_40093_1 [Eumeta japonica]|uniref:Uncharacterized protein n=1 Tax=Eumeta variegata TaxID=151549 RepID=A0A4C1X5H9_EUMVA|nr:hypothetical protein EVAR_40093_1 [Eumeta japonica]